MLKFYGYKMYAEYWTVFYLLQWFFFPMAVLKRRIYISQSDLFCRTVTEDLRSSSLLFTLVKRDSFHSDTFFYCSQQNSEHTQRYDFVSIFYFET
jgi:hypothetical protein